jgi:hypothetical protein
VPSRSLRLKKAITMSTNPNRGRVYRRCACRDRTGQQLGARCPTLARDRRHGTWTFAVDLPSLTGRRATMRRGGFPTRTDAQAALGRVLACERAGIRLDDRQTVADYLTTWLADKTLVLKPTTTANYTAYLRNDLIPTLGAIRLEKLSHTHIAQFIHRQLAAGRPPTTLRRCIATLSSALGDAVRHRRLTTPPTTRPHRDHPHQNDHAGHPHKPAHSCTTAPPSTTHSPNCSKCSSAPAYAKAKHSACTGPT